MGTAESPSAVGRPAAARPRLRGWSHLAAVLPWTAGTVVLVALAGGHPGRQLALLGYGVASVVLFAVSAAYHVGTWSPARRRLLRRLDHGNIFLLVAATYTPLSLATLTGAWLASILSVVWGLALLGYAVEVSTLRVPHLVLTACYVFLGWIAVIALPVIAPVIGGGGLALLLTAGGLYTIGALAYALRWPDLVPGWFGYHELFHVLVIAANALFFSLMVADVARRA